MGSFLKTRELSFWESVADLRVSAPGAVPSRSDVVIAGAGFCGSWLAYFLKRKHPSLQITILERDSFNLGASARNAGFLSCGNISEWLEDLRQLGWEETERTFSARIEGIRTILAELGTQISREECGSVDFDEITDEKMELARKLNSVAPFFELQGVALGREVRPAFVNTFDSAVNPAEILLALHGRLREAGVRFCWGKTVTKMERGEALLFSGERLEYGYGFLCVNAFARGLYPQTDVRPARGQIIVTSPCGTETRRCLGFLKSGYDYFRFIGDRVLVGGGRLNFKEAENTDSLETTADLKRYLVSLAEQVIGHRDFRVDYHWAGIMGLRAGRHASISDLQKPTAIDERTEEVSSCGGWGVTLTPFVTRHRAESWKPIS